MIRIFLFLLALVIVAWIVLRIRAQIRPATADPSQPKSALSTWFGLRDMALQATRSKLSLSPATSPNEPFGVVMETGLDSGTATVVGFADGSASIYLSSGGGFIGGHGQQPIRRAAQNFVVTARDFQPHMHTTSEFPVADDGRTIFYVLTDEAAYTASAPTEELAEGNHKLSSLFSAGQEIVTRYRMWDESRKP